MGRSLTSDHVYNAEKLTKAQFKKKFTDAMKAKGYTATKADDGELCYALVFSENRRWVTVLTEESTDTRKEAAELAKSLDLQVLSVELVDSDFAELTLFDKSGAVDTMFLGEPYFDEVTEPSPLKWQTMLGIDWSKVEEIQQRDHTFADDALCEFGEVIGCENMLAEYGNAGDDAEWLYFKKAKEKKLTLNSAFMQVFGEKLIPMGFVKAKTKHPFYIRALDKSFIQIIGIKKIDTNSFNIIAGLATIYRYNIDFDRNIKMTVNWLRSPCNYYMLKNLRSFKQNDMKYRRSILWFVYDPVRPETIIAEMNRALEATEKWIIDEFEKTKTLTDVIAFLDNYNPEYLDLDSPDNDFDRVSENESLLCFGLEDPFEISEIRRKLDYQLLYSRINSQGEDEINREEIISAIVKRYEELKAQISDILNNKEKYEKTLAEISGRKERNIEKLKKYGIKL